MNALGIAVVASAIAFPLGLLVDLFNRAWGRRTVEKLLKSEIKTDPSALENPKYGTVTGNTTSLKICWSKGDSVELPWGEIEEVHAFKKDLLTTDLICLAFKSLGSSEYFEIHEEMAGYHDLLNVMQESLPKFDLSWVLDVAFPAFERKHQIVWKRSTGAASSTIAVASTN